MFSSAINSDWFPTCAVFDCDGVLLDSESVWGDVQVELFKKYNLTYTPEVEESLVGSASDDLTRVIVQLSLGENTSSDEGQAFYQAVSDDVKETEFKILERGIQPIPGAHETISKLASVMPVAVASNSSGALLDEKMRIFNYSNILSAWVSSDDVENPKPAPDMYSEAIRRIGGEPARTLTVEDSPAGARAAQAAGTNTLIFTETPESAPTGNGYFSSFEDPEFIAQIDRWVDLVKKA